MSYLSILGLQYLSLLRKLTPWNSSHQPDEVEAALDQSLSNLGLDYIDLYLMHWPVASTSDGNVIDYVDVGGPS